MCDARLILSLFAMLDKAQFIVSRYHDIGFISGATAFTCVAKCVTMNAIYYIDVLDEIYCHNAKLIAVNYLCLDMANSKSTM